MAGGMKGSFIATKICEAVDGVWPVPSPPPAQAPQLVRVTDLSKADDSDIIHEALTRGFAVMRLPEPKDPA